LEAAIQKINLEGESVLPEKEVLLTGNGIKKLEDELHTLKSVKRRDVAERIRTAIGFGDISENSEYEDAKNEQAFIEGRIITLEKMLRHARVIDTSQSPGDTVGVGVTVLLKDLEYGDEIEYTIVGSAEADPTANKISNESPVGRAILGQKAGSVVEVKVPAGALKYEILGVHQ
jgi:transcription elongation factor GreA